VIRDAPTREQLHVIRWRPCARARRACERRSVRAGGRGDGSRAYHPSQLRERRDDPSPRVRRLVALWFVAQPADDEAEEDACAIRLAALPTTVRRRAQEDLIAFVLELHRRHAQR
jgi:hypothetical protein